MEFLSFEDCWMFRLCNQSKVSRELVNLIIKLKLLLELVKEESHSFPPLLGTVWPLTTLTSNQSDLLYAIKLINLLSNKT